MSPSADYRILDEPRPGGLARFAVDPLWPLFGMMFCGAWFAWLWFVFNGYAVGSPTKRKELLTAVVGFVGLVLLLVVIGNVIALPGWRSGAPYLGVIFACWKVGISYWLYLLQSRSFALYEYYGGVLRSGVVVIIAGYLLTRALLGADPGNGFLRFLLG